MIYNKTGLKPVSRPVEQVSLIRGLAVCVKACRFQVYANRQIDRQTVLVVGGCKVPKTDRPFFKNIF